jgi:hypothetical protein
VKARAEGRGARSACGLVMAVGVALVFSAASDRAALAAETLKVGDEVVLMADGPGKTMRSFPAVAFGKGVFLAAYREVCQSYGRFGSP